VYRASTAPEKVSQKASQYTAAEGGIEGNETESPSSMIYRNSLKPRHLVARNGIERNPTESLTIPLFGPSLEAAGIEPASQYRSE